MAHGSWHKQATFPVSWYRINYYENSGKVPEASQHPRLAGIIQANFPDHSDVLQYTQQDLSALAPDIFATPEEKATGGVIVQGEAPDPFAFVDGELRPVLYS